VLRIVTYFLKFWETFPNFDEFGKFGKIWEYLGIFGEIWEILGTGRLGDISASEGTMTALRHVILATEQGTSRADIH
jgi:hypothetical protein